MSDPPIFPSGPFFYYSNGLALRHFGEDARVVRADAATIEDVIRDAFQDWPREWADEVTVDRLMNIFVMGLHYRKSKIVIIHEDLPPIPIHELLPYIETLNLAFHICDMSDMQLEVYFPASARPEVDAILRAIEENPSIGDEEP